MNDLPVSVGVSPKGSTEGPRVEVQCYVVYPTGYDDFVNSDKDAWCLTVADGHSWGWRITRGINASTPLAMNRKGEWIYEQRGHKGNARRRWPLDEALEIAKRHVDTHIMNGVNAAGASADVAARIAERAS